jgi:hypothetical protein
MGTVSRLPTAARRKVPCTRLTGRQLAEQGIKRILPVVDFVDPRRSFTADMIIAEAILAQLTPEQKRAAQNAAHLFFHEVGTDHARAASAFMASIR